ncbi:MAG: winged helix-turn-helix transcriptional regulator [Pirellulales bacterium]|nr:winged helix-turn-helix transcriptional regulator [Pirellulales bacterium]
MEVLDMPTAKMTAREQQTDPDTLPEAQIDQDELDLWDERAKLLRVMAHPMRLVILRKLCERPHCVKHLNALIDISQPQLSQHMAALRNANLIACHACGPVRCYYISRPSLVKKLIPLLSEEHTSVEMDCQEIVAKARKGWEEDMSGPCEEA